MPSKFAWLDTTEHDRRRALDVIDLFSVRDTRDQLGIAGIRDAWSDRLAPGTSTIQTRARYFLFVPWIYLDLERRGVSAEKVERRARTAELGLIDAIQATDPSAVPIGAQAGQALKRLPSDIYWGGLGTLRIRLFDGARTRYHNTFGRARAPEAGEEEAPVSGNWNPHLPPAPAEFPSRASLELRPAEAEFLRDQFLQHASGSLIAFLLGLDDLWEDVDFPWDHPALPRAAEGLRADLEHARLFSLSMHGAALLYNLMLAEQLQRDDLVERYRDELARWADSVRVAARDLAAWDRRVFWATTYRLNERIPPASRQFADDWIQRVVTGADPLDLVDSTETRERIRRRELHLKRGRARLHHREHLERWSGSSGAMAINYRWPITQRLVRDVHEGLASR